MKKTRFAIFGAITFWTISLTSDQYRTKVCPEIEKKPIGILQPYMRARTIITLHTKGDFFVLCLASNVRIEYTISLIQIQFYKAVFYDVLHRISLATFL